MRTTHVGTLTSVKPAAGGAWHCRVDDALPLTILAEEWSGERPPAVGERISYRYSAPEFVRREAGR